MIDWANGLQECNHMLAGKKGGEWEQFSRHCIMSFSALFASSRESTLKICLCYPRRREGCDRLEAFNILNNNAVLVHLYLRDI